MGMDKFPTFGFIVTQHFTLGAIFIYQLALQNRFEPELKLCVGLPFSKRTEDL